MKIICWWSAGVTSAVATKLAIEKYGKENVLISYQETGQAHPDNKRFIKECEEWYGKEISSIQNAKYKNPLDLAKKIRFLAGAKGNRCTGTLKVDMRQYVEKHNKWDHQVFGFEFHKKEVNRALKIIDQYPLSKSIFPLIEKKLTKPNALYILEKAGIRKPRHYELSFGNNNCGGCLKADAKGYWGRMFELSDPHINKNKKEQRWYRKIVRKTAILEQEIGYSVIRHKVSGVKKRLFLKDLSRGMGRDLKEIMPQCGILCAIEFEELIDERVDNIMKGQIDMADLWTQV